MATDPNPSLTPKASPDSSLPAEVEQALSSGLADCSLRELLGLLLSSVAQAERQAFLENQRERSPSTIADNLCHFASCRGLPPHPLPQRRGQRSPAPNHPWRQGWQQMKTPAFSWAW